MIVIFIDPEKDFTHILHIAAFKLRFETHAFSILTFWKIAKS